eukprot:m.251664 g.251664  ORF g.251664 m.251664 type:complete len:71 (+) comp40338_c0_seq2:1701-1913(+)
MKVSQEVELAVTLVWTLVVFSRATVQPIIEKMDDGYIAVMKNNHLCSNKQLDIWKLYCHNMDQLEFVTLL